MRKAGSHSPFQLHPYQPHFRGLDPIQTVVFLMGALRAFGHLVDPVLATKPQR